MCAACRAASSSSYCETILSAMTRPLSSAPGTLKALANFEICASVGKRSPCSSLLRSVESMPTAAATTRSGSFLSCRNFRMNSPKLDFLSRTVLTNSVKTGCANFVRGVNNYFLIPQHLSRLAHVMGWQKRSHLEEKRTSEPLTSAATRLMRDAKGRRGGKISSFSLFLNGSYLENTFSIGQPLSHPIPYD